MSDKMQLRDHNHPCEHGKKYECGSYWINGAASGTPCPGGRELTPTEMDWCSTHKITWTTDDPNDPDDWCLARYAWADGECVRSTVLIVEEQHGD